MVYISIVDGIHKPSNTTGSQRCTRLLNCRCPKVSGSLSALAPHHRWEKNDVVMIQV